MVIRNINKVSGACRGDSMALQKSSHPLSHPVGVLGIRHTCTREDVRPGSHSSLPGTVLTSPIKTGT